MQLYCYSTNQACTFKVNCQSLLFLHSGSYNETIRDHTFNGFWMNWSRKLHPGSRPTASQQLTSIQSTGLVYSSSKTPACQKWWTSINCFTLGLLALVLHYLLMDTGRGKTVVHATVHPGAILGFLKLIESLPWFLDSWDKILRLQGTQVELLPLYDTTAEVFHRFSSSFFLLQLLVYNNCIITTYSSSSCSLQGLFVRSVDLEFSKSSHTH